MSWRSAAKDPFIPERSVSLSLRFSLVPVRCLSPRARRPRGRPRVRAAALRAEGGGCVGAGQGCGETAGGNLVAGPEGTGRGAAVFQSISLNRKKSYSWRGGGWRTWQRHRAHVEEEEN